MKKLLLGTLLLGTLLTGCGMKAGEVETVTETVCKQAIETSEEFVEDVYETMHWTEEEFEEARSYTLYQIEEDYNDNNINEECKNELIELVNSLVYDDSYDCGYDYEALMKNMLSILAKYELLPEECADMTIDEIYESMV